MGAQFTIPLITVIPGQLIASALWNNEWQNLNVNLIPAGIDSYSTTDTQMQIQTNPFPGGVTSHATSLGGEIERLRFQLALAFGTTFWYDNPNSSIPTFAGLILNAGAGNSVFFSLSPGGTRQGGMAVDTSDTYVDFGGTLGRLLFRPFAGGTSTASMILNPTFLDMLGNQIKTVGNPTVAGDAVPYLATVIAGSASNAGPAGMIVAETISTPDIRPQAITPGLLGGIAGAGLTGGNGNVLSINVDNSTLDINGSNIFEVKSGGITLTQMALTAYPVLKTGNLFAGNSVATQVLSVSNRGRINSIAWSSGGSSIGLTLTVVLDGVTRASLTYSKGSAMTAPLYVNPDGSITIEGGFSIFGLDFSTSAVITLSGGNNKILTVGYVTP